MLGLQGRARAVGAGRWRWLLQQSIKQANKQPTSLPSQRHAVFGNEGKGGVGRWLRRPQVPGYGLSWSPVQQASVFVEKELENPEGGEHQVDGMEDAGGGVLSLEQRRQPPTAVA